MKRLLVPLFACATFALMACDDDVSGSPKNTDNEEITHVVDTLYLSSKDTVVIKDSVFLKDSVLIKDSVYLKDTVILKDSVFAKDTVVLKDSILLKDTVYVIDSLTKGDTSCVVTDQGASFKIQCKDKVPYILNKATCNGKAYDPAIDLCNDSTILAIEHADTCKGIIYDSREFFCSASEKVVAKCDGKTYDADSLFCYFDTETETYSTPKRCGGLEYDINKYECEKEIVIGYCGETKYNVNRVDDCQNGMLVGIIQTSPWGGTDKYVRRCPSGLAYPISGQCFDNANCKRFDWDDCVECKEGFFGENCDECAKGFYGKNCDQIVTCEHGEQYNSIYAADGYCIPGSCTGDYTGVDCNIIP